MFNLAINWNYLEINPFKGVKFFKVTNTKPVIFTDQEFQRLCENSCPSLRRVLITAIHTGMRRGEITSLKWKHINFKEKFILVEDTKNNDFRTIPLHPNVEKLLLEISKDKMLDDLVFGYKNGNSLQNSFRKAMKRARVTGPTFHSLRHTFATQLIMQGIDIVTVQQLLGHKSIQMTMRYSHPTPEHKIKAVLGLNISTIENSREEVKSIVVSNIN